MIATVCDVQVVFGHNTVVINVADYTKPDGSKALGLDLYHSSVPITNGRKPGDFVDADYPNVSLIFPTDNTKSVDLVIGLLQKIREKITNGLETVVPEVPEGN